MSHHPEKNLPKFDPEKGALANNHINNLFLASQMMRVQHDDVDCRPFPHTFKNKASTWYQSLPIASIRTWEEF